MKKHIASLFLLSGMLIFASVGDGQEAEKERPSNKATKDDYRKLLSAGSFTGKVSVTAKTVSFKIDDSEYQKQLKIAAKAKNPVEQKAAKLRVETQFAAMKWALGKEFELDLEPKALLQKLHAPTVEFDDKGFPKASKVSGPPYPAAPEDFGGDYMTKIQFGGFNKNGKLTVRSAIVDNKSW